MLCLNNDNDEFKVKLFKPTKDQMTFIVSWYVKNKRAYFLLAMIVRFCGLKSFLLFLPVSSFSFVIN